MFVGQDFIKLLDGWLTQGIEWWNGLSHEQASTIGLISVVVLMVMFVYWLQSEGTAVKTSKRVESISLPVVPAPIDEDTEDEDTEDEDSDDNDLYFAYESLEKQIIQMNHQLEQSYTLMHELLTSLNNMHKQDIEIIKNLHSNSTQTIENVIDKFRPEE